MEWLTKMTHCLCYQDDSYYLYLTSNCRNYKGMDKIANRVGFLGTTSSFGLEGETLGWV